MRLGVAGAGKVACAVAAVAAALGLLWVLWVLWVLWDDCGCDVRVGWVRSSSSVVASGSSCSLEDELDEVVS